jgi:hypothetical protein
MDRDELKEIAEQIWAAVEYGRGSVAWAHVAKIKADAWDEGHRYAFHVDPPNGEGNPYKESK